jgi:predicted MFS family arabinose efflux permease
LLSLPFVLSALANTAQATAFNLFIHLPGYLNALGANDLVIGLIFGATGVAAVASRPPIGRVIDTHGRRRVILFGGVLNVVSAVAYLGVTAIGPWIVFVRVLHGVAEGVLFTALATYGADCVPEERRTQGLSLFAVSSMLPIALGAWLGEEILERADYRELFQAAVAFSLVSLLLSLFLPDRRPAPVVGEEAPHGFRAALGQRDLLPLWFVTTIFAVAMSAVFTFLKRFVDETGLGSVSQFFGALTVTALVVRIGFGWLPDRLGPVRILVPSMASVAAALALLAVTGRDASILVAGILFGLGHGYIYPVVFGMVVSRARDADRGSAVGIFTSLFDVGGVVGAPLFGGVITLAGFSPMYALAATIVVGGTAIFLAWDARVRGA